MRVRVVNQYVEAASEVLAKESGEAVQRGGLRLEANPYTTDDVTAVVGISGDLAGSLYLSMSGATALRLVGRMLGQAISTLDELVQSGIAELANVIAGSAGVALAQDGVTTTISPPLTLVGAGGRLSSVEIQRLVVTLTSACGEVHVHVALRGVA